MKIREVIYISLNKKIECIQCCNKKPVQGLYQMELDSFQTFAVCAKIESNLATSCFIDIEPTLVVESCFQHVVVKRMSVNNRTKKKILSWQLKKKKLEKKKKCVLAWCKI